VPEQPVTLRFPDKTEITVLRATNTIEQERLLRPLVARCGVAAFGVGRQTRYDRNVRDALQIKARLSVAPFPSFTSTPPRRVSLNRSVASWRHRRPAP